ncbi:MAG TPA: penicillin acylase family protein [Rhodothermales bacterium]|nr:penicillin acylase family protein [Rhodothermales bacterium]
MPSPRYARRRFSFAGLALVFLGLLGVVGLLAVAVGWLAYGTGPRRAGEVEVPGLASPVTVGWPEGGAPLVEAADEAGLYAGLGYVHASDDAWAMVLWRQAALGELGAWYPARTPLDRHARALGFAATARRAYDALSPAERAPLDAYAAGVNAALALPGVAQRDEFVLLDVRPERWQPWHALAVERLLAWLATPSLDGDSAFAAARRTDRGVDGFVETDSLFRAYLRLGDFTHARAYSGRLAGGAPFFAVAQPWGSSALPLFHEIVLSLAGRRVTTATIPGTLALPFGQDDRQAWAVLLTGEHQFAPDTEPAPPPVSDRLVDRDGDETLLTFSRTTAYLYLAPDPRPVRTAPARPAPTPPDTSAGRPAAGTRPAPTSPARPAAPARTAPRPQQRPAAFRPQQTRPPAPRTPAATRPAPTQPAPTTAPATPAGTATPVPTPAPTPPPAPAGWRLTWSGFAPVTELAAWRALLAGQDPTFRTFRGAGLRMTRDGTTSSFGSPVVRREVPGGLFVGENRDASFAAARLASLLARPRPPGSAQQVLDDTYSPWAAGRARALSTSLGPRESVPDSLNDAYAFLRGWDGSYTPDAIGATIFELWLRAHRQSTGRLPVAAPDSLARLQLYRTLGATMAYMRTHYGDEAADWRWGQVQPGTLEFPVWAADDAHRAGARYAPVEPHTGGHPTALRVGTSFVLGGGAPGVWEAWTTGPGWGSTAVRHPGVETFGFLSRARATGAPPRPVLLNRSLVPERTVRLVAPEG